MVFSTEYLLAFVIGLIVFLFAQKWYKYKDMPPGPWGLPFLGYMPFLIIGRNPYKAFQVWKEKYGKLFSLTMGNFNCVVINDYKLIQEAYKQDVFCGRPDFEIQITRCNGKKRGIMFSDGKTWMEQRRFALKSLRNFGFGKHDSMEVLLQNEAVELGNYFTENIGKPINVRNRFNASVLNSLWHMATGKRFELNDPDFLFMITNLIDNFQQAISVGPIFFLPGPLKHGFLVKGFWKTFLDTRDRIQGLIRTCINEHKQAFNPEEDHKDFVDALIAQIKSTDDPDSSFYGSEGEINALISLLDLFVAGAETSSSILQWAMLTMVKWPHVQAKVQAEIDRVVGPNRLPSFDDRTDLVYTDATLCEIHRFFTLVPFGVYHATMADATLGGYKIPKNTVLMANIRDAHHDKTYWGDPENFRPERFIDAETNKLRKHDAFMPFSSGKRTCLGETLAKDTFFMFVTYLMQRFRLEMPPGVGEPSIEPNAPTFIVAPKRYEFVIKART